MGGETLSRARAEQNLSQLLTDDQLAVYGPLLKAAREAGIRCALGGGLAASAYSGHLRNTKDMDLYVVAPDHDRLIALMGEQGFTEYRAVPYDPTWSYRGNRGEFIVDLLWRMLNDRKAVDDFWTSAGWELNVRGVTFKLIPREELLWSKLYILNRERTDWTDILNLLYAQGPAMEWHRLLRQLGEDVPVMAAVLSLFKWMCPGRASQFPPALWDDVGLTAPDPDAPLVDRYRTKLFTDEQWFTAELS